MSNLLLALLSSFPILHLAVQSGGTTAPSKSLPKAEDILARLEADIGSPEARAKVNNVVVHAKLAVEGMPGEGRMEEIYAGTDRARWNILLPGLGEGMLTTRGTTGKFSYTCDFATGVSILEGEDQAGALRQFTIGRGASWKTAYARAETVAKVKIDGRDAFEIRLFPAKGEPETWIVDAETSRLVCSDLQLPEPLGGTYTVRSWPSDWKVVEGIRYAHTTKLQFGVRGPATPEPIAMTYTVTSIEHPDAIAPERVAPPKEVLEAYANPAKRRRPAPSKSGDFVKTTLEPQPTATVRMKIPANEVAQHLSVIFPEVMGHLMSSGADMAGPPFTLYHAMSDETIDLEAGFPVRKKIEGKGRIHAGELPGGDAAVMWHIGPYEELPKSYEMLASWIQSQGLRARGGHWEVYWTDPGMEPDPTKWRTQIVWPVEGGK